MASLDSVLTRQALARGVVRQANNDAAVGIRLRYLGTGTVTSVTVDSGTDFELITSDGGTDTYTFATYTTIGALADAINGDGIFEAKVMDALRSEGSDDWFLAASPVTPTVDENGVTIWDCVADTSGAATIACVLSPFENFDMPKGHRVHLQEIVYSANNTAAANTLQIWKRKGTVETQIAGLTSVDTTITTVNFASGQGKITAGVDEEIVVIVTGTVVDGAGNLVRLIGQYE